MKYMFCSLVLISNACGLLIASSAPLMLKHLFTSIIPRGCVFCGDGGNRKRRGVRAGHEGGTAAQPRQL